MIYFTEYDSQLIGKLVLASDGEKLIGCWFQNDRFFGYGVDETPERNDTLPAFEATRNWLDRYFAGESPDPSELVLAPRGSNFQLEVWKILSEIPYGQTVTYGDIARRIAAERGSKMSAQAVGGAVGRNPLCVIIPCHRVMGAKGNLTGFGGGIEAKVALLEHEGVNAEQLRRPKRGTALVGCEDASAQWSSAKINSESAAPTGRQDADMRQPSAR